MKDISKYCGRFKGRFKYGGKDGDFRMDRIRGSWYREVVGSLLDIGFLCNCLGIYVGI